MNADSTPAREYERLEHIAETFSTHEGFNKAVIEYGFRSLQEHFRGARCLEMGSADGAMTRLLAQAWDDLTVVEGSKRFASLIEEDLGPAFPGLRVVHSLFEAFVPEAPFDTIIAAHILEHVDDPVAVARAARKWIAADGRLLVVVPNAHSFNRLLGVEMGLIEHADELVAGDFAVGHRRVYTPDGLVRDLEAAGWRVETRSGVLFKPLSNAQMVEHFTPAMVEGCWRLGKQFPDNAGDILCVAAPA